MIAIIKILTNKNTYIIIFILSLVIIFSVLFLRIKNYKSKIENLNTEIENLKVTNIVLQKDVLFNLEKIKILEGFTNSGSKIEIIEKRGLTYEEKDAINAVSNDFYNYFKEVKNENIYISNDEE